MTLADIVIGSTFFKLAYNEGYDNQHIMQAVMAKYKRLSAWAERMYDDFKEFFNKEEPTPF